MTHSSDTGPGRVRWRAAARLGAVLAMLFALSAPVLAQEAAEIEFWKSVQNSKNPAELQAYIQAFPNGKFVPLARLRIGELTGKPPVPPAPAANVEHPPPAPATTAGQQPPAAPPEAPPPSTAARQAAPSGPSHASLAAAIRRGDMGAVKAALARGVDVNRPDETGIPPIGLAALLGKPAMIAYLAANGADPNRNDRYGFTPLMNAAVRGHAEAVRILLALGADPTLHGANGNDALGVAHPFGRADRHYEGKLAVIKLLESAIAVRLGHGVPPERAAR